MDKQAPCLYAKAAMFHQDGCGLGWAASNPKDKGLLKLGGGKLQ